MIIVQVDSYWCLASVPEAATDVAENSVRKLTNEMVQGGLYRWYVLYHSTYDTVSAIP
jgi:hypothetical protein